MNALRSLAPAAALAALLVAVPAGAHDPGAHRTPPPEAYGACEGKAASDACSVALPDRTVTGSCVTHDGGALFCRPDRPPPPPEAFAACSGKASGEACSVTTDRGTLAGTCAAATEGQLFCRPPHPPPPGR